MVAKKKRMGPFHKLLNQLIAKLSSAWENKGQMLSSKKKCLCLPFEYCSEICNRQRTDIKKEVAVEGEAKPLTTIKMGNPEAPNQPDQTDNGLVQISDPDYGSATVALPQEENQLTLGDAVSFAQKINSCVLLNKFDSVFENLSESVDQFNEAHPVYILQLNCGDGNTPRENLEICDEMGLAEAAKTWRRIMGALGLSEIPLIRAVQAGNLTKVEELIGEGAYIDAQDSQGTSGLMVASQEGHAKIVETLVKAGASLDIQSEYGRTALHRASDKGHHQVVETLVKAGASLDVQNNINRWTALHEASDRGHHEVVETLVEAVASLDVQSKAGNTAMHKASMRGYTKIVEILVKAGAKVDVKNKEGKSLSLKETCLKLTRRKF